MSSIETGKKGKRAQPCTNSILKSNVQGGKAKRRESRRRSKAAGKASYSRRDGAPWREEDEKAPAAEHNKNNSSGPRYHSSEACTLRGANVLLQKSLINLKGSIKNPKQTRTTKQPAE